MLCTANELWFVSTKYLDHSGLTTSPEVNGQNCFFNALHKSSISGIISRNISMKICNFVVVTEHIWFVHVLFLLKAWGKSTESNIPALWITWKCLENLVLSACSQSTEALTHQGEAPAAWYRVTEDEKRDQVAAPEVRMQFF